MSQKEEVRDTINKLFEASGVRYKYRGPITEQTAVIVGRVITEIKSCSNTLSWVPRPTGTPSISWVAKNLGKSFVRQMNKDKVSITCGKRVLQTYRTPLELSGY